MTNTFRNILTLPLAAFFALTHMGFAEQPLTSKEAINAKQGTSDCVYEILSKRFSGYDYDSTRPVTRTQLKAILEAGRLAPSSYNEQPWNFIVCDKISNPAAYEKALDLLVEFNQNWAKNAPVLVLVVAASQSSTKEQVNRHAQYDTGAASFGMMLEATSLGLMSHQMGGFDEVKAKQVFAIPTSFTPMSVMAIGYPLASQVPPERKRKELSENFFDGTWGQAFK